MDFKLDEIPAVPDLWNLYHPLQVKEQQEAAQDFLKNLIEELKKEKFLVEQFMFVPVKRQVCRCFGFLRILVGELQEKGYTVELVERGGCLPLESVFAHRFTSDMWIGSNALLCIYFPHPEEGCPSNEFGSSSDGLTAP